MIVKTAQYEVRAEALDECLRAIEAYVAEIDATQPGTIVYRALRDMERPTRFLHIMLFADDEAEEIHGDSEATQRFTGVLYPNTLAPVEFAAWEPVAMVDRTA